MTEKRPRSFKEIEGWDGNQKKKEKLKEDDYESVESTLARYSEYSSKDVNLDSISSKKINSYDFDVTPEIIRKVDADSRSISINNKNLEQKIKAEIAGINIFKKGGHIVKTVLFKDYRDSTADDLINDQLRVTGEFKDSIKGIYLKLNDELNKNSQNINNLERDYFRLIDRREEVKLEIKKTREDYVFLKKMLDNRELEGIGKEKIKTGSNNAHRRYRKAMSELDELNNSLVTNVEERKFDYTSEIIFERYEGAFKKIYNVAESEIRKINNVKALYLDVMRGGRIVKNLEKSFSDVFASLKMVDNVLLKGINSLLESSSGRGTMGELRDEKSRNSQRLLKTLKENYAPDAERLNEIVEDYIKNDQ